MTDTQQETAPDEAVPAPEPLERGRYAVFETPDGGWAIARSRPLCDNCVACGCGEQADPVMVPAMVVAMVTGAGNGKIPAPVRALLGKVARNG